MKSIRTHNNSVGTRWVALGIGFLVNVIGNSLTVVSGQGAEPWTAAAANLSRWSGASIGSFVILFGVAEAIINQGILSHNNRKRLHKHQKHRWERHHFKRKSHWKQSKEMNHETMQKINYFFDDPIQCFAEILYIFIFGYAIDWTVLIFDKMHWDKLPIPFEIGMSIIGVILFCAAISVYQRANLFMHPNDDTSNLIRFHLLHGSAFWSQTWDIIPALLICGVAWFYDGSLTSIGIGTIFSLLFNGIIIGLSDHWIWSNLVHNKRHTHIIRFKIKY